MEMHLAKHHAILHRDNLRELEKRWVSASAASGAAGSRLVGALGAASACALDAALLEAGVEAGAAVSDAAGPGDVAEAGGTSAERSEARDHGVSVGEAASAMPNVASIKRVGRTKHGRFNVICAE